MRLLAIELSDAGIMAAAKDPLKLLQLDRADIESPGFALPDRDGLLVGRAAERQAHLHPLEYNNVFWDQLNTEPLKQPNEHAQNHAEMAYAHLARIWEKIKGHGDEVVMAVPAFFGRDQLGLVLGIAEALSMPLNGMVSLSIAAASKPCLDEVMLHLDIHLHRSEVTFLEQGDRLTQRESVTVRGKGLHHLYTEWVKVIGDEFVRKTRFDPLHLASTEQELYDRLPALIAALQRNPSMMFEMVMGSETYRINVSRDFMEEKARSVFGEIARLIEEMRKRHGKPGQPVLLQLTHRIGSLPGCKEMVATLDSTRTIELAPGAGALGALALWKRPSGQEIRGGLAFLTSRPWQGQEPTSPAHPLSVQAIPHTSVVPTHVLYRSIAYPISERALVIGSGDTRDGVDLPIHGELAGVSRRHCSLQRREDEVILTDHSTYGTFVDGERVSGQALLRLGQIIRVGTPGEELQLIACAERDGT